MLSALVQVEVEVVQTDAADHSWGALFWSRACFFSSMAQLGLPGRPLRLARGQR